MCHHLMEKWINRLDTLNIIFLLKYLNKMNECHFAHQFQLANIILPTIHPKHQCLFPHGSCLLSPPAFPPFPLSKSPLFAFHPFDQLGPNFSLGPALPPPTLLQFFYSSCLLLSPTPILLAIALIGPLAPMPPKICQCQSLCWPMSAHPFFFFPQG